MNNLHVDNEIHNHHYEICVKYISFNSSLMALTGKNRRWCVVKQPGACPGGGPRGLGPPPLEIEKQKKKKKKKVIRANIKLFHLYFATFLVENIIFSASF